MQGFALILQLTKLRLPSRSGLPPNAARIFCTAQPVSCEASAVVRMIPAEGPPFGVAQSGTWIDNDLAAAFCRQRLDGENIPPAAVQARPVTMPGLALSGTRLQRTGLISVGSGFSFSAYFWPLSRVTLRLVAPDPNMQKDFF